jgi:myosin-1
LFFLEEMVERKDYEYASKITKAWKRWTLAKRALEQRARAANILRGRKERRSDSVSRQYVGDYMNYDDNFGLQEEITKHSRKLD